MGMPMVEIETQQRSSARNNITLADMKGFEEKVAQLLEMHPDIAAEGLRATGDWDEWRLDMNKTLQDASLVPLGSDARWAVEGEQAPHITVLSGFCGHKPATDRKCQISWDDIAAQHRSDGTTPAVTAPQPYVTDSAQAANAIFAAAAASANATDSVADAITAAAELAGSGNVAAAADITAAAGAEPAAGSDLTVAAAAAPAAGGDITAAAAVTDPAGGDSTAAAVAAADPAAGGDSNAAAAAAEPAGGDTTAAAAAAAAKPAAGGDNNVAAAVAAEPAGANYRGADDPAAANVKARSLGCFTKEAIQNIVKEYGDVNGLPCLPADFWDDEDFYVLPTLVIFQGETGADENWLRLCKSEGKLLNACTPSGYINGELKHGWYKYCKAQAGCPFGKRPMISQVGCVLTTFNVSIKLNNVFKACHGRPITIAPTRRLPCPWRWSETMRY
jgi:hypothetical protein